MNQARLNKFISDSGLCSRRKAEELISSGRVTVNGRTVTNLATKINLDSDEVSVDGEKIKENKFVYFLLNKPKGVISTTDDEKRRRTVTDLIKSNHRIYPVGRLDCNSTGVLFLTNDGDFSYLLTHPGNRVPREYEVKLDQPLSSEHKNLLLKGIKLAGVRGKFEQLMFPKQNDQRIVAVTAVEGRNHFVKRMFNSLGYNVIALKRISYAGVQLDIPIGSYRALSVSEINRVKLKYGK